MEVINLLSIGLSSYNHRLHVPTDIPTNGYYIPNDNMKTQDYLNKISKWTTENKMKLNKEKSKAMIFNFTNYQFAARTEIENENLEIIKETKLLGVLVNDRLNWNSNTAYLVTRANARMRILHKLVDFSIPKTDLINIYKIYVRSVLEQSCQVWHSSLTQGQELEMERGVRR